MQNSEYLKYDQFVAGVDQHLTGLMNETGAVPYFLTVTYKPFEILGTGSDPIYGKLMLESFENCYARLMNGKTILGNNYQRKCRSKPLTYAFLDYPLTSKKRKTDGITDFQRMKLQKGHPELTPHIHSIMMIHPKNVDRLDALGSQGMLTIFRRVDDRIMTIDLQRARRLRAVFARNIETNVKRFVTDDNPVDPATERAFEEGVIPYSSKYIKRKPWLLREEENVYITLPDPDVTFPTKTERKIAEQINEDRTFRKWIDQAVARNTKRYKRENAQ
jgi:hypothetical protein